MGVIREEIAENNADSEPIISRSPSWEAMRERAEAAAAKLAQEKERNQPKESAILEQRWRAKGAKSIGSVVEEEKPKTMEELIPKEP